MTSFSDMEKRRPSRRQPSDNDFGSLMMLAATAGAFLVVTWVAAMMEAETPAPGLRAEPQEPAAA
jgi:hypothetical protein